LVSYTKNAINGFLIVGIASDHVIPVPTNLVDISGCAVRRVSNTKFVTIAAEPTSPPLIYLCDISNTARTLLRSSTSIPLDPAIFSTPVTISFPRRRGKEQEGRSHAIFIPPHNPSFTAPSDSKPPLIINIHGGPTHNASAGLSLSAQYWTSRGYAYADVNYIGSTGYGRAYYQGLNHFWGIKDVDDAASCLDYLSSAGYVDGSKVGITGGSSGGYTVLQSLVTYPKLYAAGLSRYGIGNLKLLATGTHKFESHYLFELMFPTGTSEAEQDRILHERSPVNYVGKIESPLVLLQGQDDRVVPLEQAEEMERVLKEGGKDVQLVVFEGEGHGWRKEENIRRAVVEEEGLWRRTLLA